MRQSLDDEVQYLKGVGPRGAASLAKLGLFTVRDVLYHLPRRYEDRRNLPPIAKLQHGAFATIKGQVTEVATRTVSGGRVIVEAAVEDASGTATLIWFNQPWIRRQLQNYRGEIIAYGQAKMGRYAMEIASPEFEVVDDESDPDEFARIVPVYPLKDGVWQRQIRTAARSAVAKYAGQVEDPIPSSILREQKLRPLAWCLAQIHAPDSEESRLEARRRLVFEEFFYLQISLALKRNANQGEIGISFPVKRLMEGVGEAAATADLFVAATVEAREPLRAQIRRILPFELTKAQRRVVAEIWRDMELPHPMNRLVQGDVGSGKTAVAACAMLAAVRSGYQAAMMAPTEILAEQHYSVLRRLFDPIGVNVALLVGKLTATEKKKAGAQAASGQAQIAIGTHALIEEGVEFQNLGLVVVDEQHRFGVMQRAAMREKSHASPDMLVMTATPIPRTLTMVQYGDLDVSVIDELPPGRSPVKTSVRTPQDRRAIYETVRKLISEGRQAYFVCPMVSESEKMLAQAAEELYARLSVTVFADARVGLLHGQMKRAAKEAVMEEFRFGAIDVLVSTTVIEVGVDVPNASVMVVEDANRFGLSQLHQLRGRVGRGSVQSYCILIADPRNDDSKERLGVMEATTDGFEIANADLRIRGPGELAGTRQSGNLDFKIADLVQDGAMLEAARQAAMRLVESDPDLSLGVHRKLLDIVSGRRTLEAVVAIS